MIGFVGWRPEVSVTSSPPYCAAMFGVQDKDVPDGISLSDHLYRGFIEHVIWHADHGKQNLNVVVIYERRPDQFDEGEQGCE